MTSHNTDSCGVRLNLAGPPTLALGTQFLQLSLLPHGVYTSRKPQWGVEWVVKPTNSVVRHRHFNHQANCLLPNLTLLWLMLPCFIKLLLALPPACLPPPLGPHSAWASLLSDSSNTYLPSSHMTFPTATLWNALAPLARSWCRLQVSARGPRWGSPWPPELVLKCLSLSCPLNLVCCL